MNHKRISLSALLACLAVASSSLKSIAHAPVANPHIIPVAHTATALRLLTGKVAQDASFNHLTKALLASHLTTYTRANSLLQTKSIVGSGILNGIKARINGAPINGAYSGTAYENFFGHSVTSFAQIYQGLGSNPLATSMSPTVTLVNPSTVFNYTKSTGFASAALAKELGQIKSVLKTNPTFALQYNSLKEGENIGNTGLTGGLLSGQEYDGFFGGTSYTAYSQNAYAFGKNLFNTGLSGPTTLNPYTSGSYLTFLNKIKIPITSGQFVGNIYEGFGTSTYSNLGPFLFAIGKNPLNNGINGYLVLSSQIKALSYLKY